MFHHVMLIVCDAVRIMRMTMFLCQLSIGNWGSCKCKCSDPVQPVSNCSNDGGAMVGIRFMMRVKSNCPRGKLVESKSFTSNKSHLFVQPQQLLEHLSFLRPPLHCWRRDGLFDFSTPQYFCLSIPQQCLSQHQLVQIVICGHLIWFVDESEEKVGKHLW